MKMGKNLIPDEDFREGRFVVFNEGVSRDRFAGMRIVGTTDKRVYVGELMFGEKPFYLSGQGGRKQSRPYVPKDEVVAIVDTEAQFNVVEQVMLRHAREVAEANAVRNHQVSASRELLVSDMDRIGVPHNLDRTQRGDSR